MPTAQAADMFAASLESWGTEAVAAGLSSEGHVAELTSSLLDLRSSGAVGEIIWLLHQAVYERPAV